MGLKHTRAIASWTRQHSRWSGLVDDDTHDNVAVDVEAGAEVEIRLGARSWDRVDLLYLCEEADERGWWYVVQSIRADAERVARYMARRMGGTPANRADLIEAATDAEFLLSVAKGYRLDDSDFRKHVAARVAYRVRSADRRDRNRSRLFDLFRVRSAIAASPQWRARPEDHVLHGDALRRARALVGEVDWAWLLAYIDNDDRDSKSTKDRARAHRIRARLDGNDDEDDD
jgi:hypothetical protein